MNKTQLLSTVALMEDVPEKGLRRGQVVEAFSAGVYEIEFSDDAGRAYANLAIAAKHLLPLLHEPEYRAA
jgi:hypothetical protein